MTNLEILSNKEGDSILVENSVIASIGREEALKRRAKASVKIIDCKGFYAIPGLGDAHVHLLSYGLYKNRLDLSKTASIEDIKKLVAEKAEEIGPGKWIVGRGWDQEKLVEKRAPNRWDLDEAAPRNPVLLYRVCGHVAVANGYALRIAGIDENTEDPRGGRFGREDGRISGVLYEKAVEIVEEKIEKPSIREAAELIADVLSEAASYGLVELHAMSVDEYEFKVLDFMDKTGMLKLRIKAYLETDFGNVRYGKRGRNLEICGIKVIADGSFGARTAYLRAPYSDAPNTKGELLIDAARLAVIFKSAEERGLEVAVHAIGDGAIEEVLKAVRKSGFKKARIEHASLTPPDIIERIAELEIPVSVQPHFILSDWWIAERLGARRTRWVYAYKSLLARGVKVMGSSDAPVEPLNPWLGIYAAVDRGRREKLNIWRFSNQEALGTREALQLYLNTENRCLKEGEIADIAVIKFSPFAQSDVRENRVILVTVDGRIVYCRI